MNANQLLNEILALLYQIKESREDLQKVHDFMCKNFVIEEEPDLVIPEQYKELVAEIADEIQCGFICKVNKRTGTIISLTREDSYGYNYYTDVGAEDGEENHSNATSSYNQDDIITIYPLKSHESFRVMENFVLSLNECQLKHQLSLALQWHKPFANFNGIIHNLPERDEWFAFRKHALEQHVAAILMAEMTRENQ
jgi:hypothetical protein